MHFTCDYYIYHQYAVGTASLKKPPSYSGSTRVWFLHTDPRTETTETGEQSHSRTTSLNVLLNFPYNSKELATGSNLILAIFRC